MSPTTLLLTIVLLAFSAPARAGESPGTEPSAPDASPGNRAASKATSWRDRYELGPGDVINFSLFGRPELDRPGFRIAPDGTVSYLQAQNVKIAGLTLDEARVLLEEGLKDHFKSPRVIITPQEIGSKRFSILGKVVRKGVYTLASPTTLLEAIAQAGGIETGLFERKTVELADLDRSFISRNGKQLPVDFRRLLHEGDVSQNIEIEPQDFIFIASTISNDYYVLGAVKNPGVQGMTADASVVSAISRRGGLTDRAWTDRVLVIRGSFSDPESHVISLRDILAARQNDFQLKPKDIVFVSEKPWADAEDILKVALSAFATSATATWVNANVNTNP